MDKEDHSHQAILKMARKKPAPGKEPPKTIKTDDAKKATLLAKNAAHLAEFAATALVTAQSMGIKSKPLENFWLAPAQREVLLGVPAISQALKAKLTKEKASFTVAEVASMTTAIAEFPMEGEPRKLMAIMLVAKHLTEQLQQGIAGLAKPMLSKAKEPRAKADPNILFQFKITLIDSRPPIWRRIQVADGNLDKLHEHIQTSMGWTNSHLHHFRVGEQLYGDPMLLHETMNEMNYKASTRTKISKIVPKAAKGFSVVYEYDFGDGWEHEVLFEGCPKKEPGKKYPLCLDGERACPPEDVGGIGGYEDFLEAIGNKKHEEREVMFEWVDGWFDPEEFDPVVATKSMMKGLPDWRDVD